METQESKICPHCQKEILEADEIQICPACQTPHHASCWKENHGCGAEGCSQNRNSHTISARTYCSSCGAPLEAGHTFCPKCGQKVGETDSEAPQTATHPKKKLYIAFAGIALVAIIVILLVSGGPNLAKVYDDIGANSYYCTLAEDGSYLQIDTNPSDLDSYSAEEAWEMVEAANRALGFSDSLDKKMLSTRALDGRQTEMSGKISVSWSYHPNDGLEVIYEIK